MEKAFSGPINDALSQIELTNYSTENNLEVKSHYKFTDEYGQVYEGDVIKAELTMEDFLGLNSITDGTENGDLTNVPQEFADFIELFTLDYESTRDQLKDANGNPLSLEDYLTTVLQYGEFDNTEEKPVLQFISNILDITIIKPLIEAALGYDLITQRELSDLERGLKAGCALIDAVTMLVGIKASGVVSLFSKEALEAAGKTMAIDLVANTAAYGVEKLGEELGLPWPVTMLLSLGAGMTVSISGSKYVFENSAGTMKFEADISEVKALLEKQGITNVDEVIERLAKGVTEVSEGGSGSGTVWDNIVGTADNMPATEIPATFKIDLDNGISYINPETGTSTLWTNSNATKHMGEYISRFGEESWSIGTRSQAMLESYSTSLNKAMSELTNMSPGRYFNTYGSWELGINTETGVVYHARMIY